ncbi:MAG: hypothetical protein KBI32_10250 [Phycisphaerae bacterium]|nr:hypothetical protein [Phycisphaerae bacterium]
MHTHTEITTGNPRLDQMLDALPLDAVLAMLAMLDRHGQDGVVDRVKDRLEERAERFDHPDALMDLCMALDDGALEDRVIFWQTWRDAWNPDR